MANLYKPLADKDYEWLSSVLKTAQKFARKVLFIYVSYAILVAIIYPIVIKTSFTWFYVFTLTLILICTTIFNYYFGLTYTLLLQADQRAYIISTFQICYAIVNLVLSYAIVILYPEVHVLKLINCLLYLFQPIYFIAYINKNYKINKNANYDSSILNSRWSAFGQNIAYYIHMNTDIVILTVYASVSNVSVYSVYMSVIIAVKSLSSSFSSAIVPTLGNALVSKDTQRKNRVFDLYEFITFIVAFLFFTCCMLLITPFIDIYTANITDFNYHQLAFGILLTLSELIYCIRAPYVNAAYACKMFKETSVYAYAEAIINIIISVLLVRKFGILGVAVGTVVAMLYRLLCHIIFLKKNILYRPIMKALKIIVICCGTTSICSYVFYCFIFFNPVSYISWLLLAIKTFLVSSCLFLIVCLMFFRKQVKSIFSIRASTKRVKHVGGNSVR